MGICGVGGALEIERGSLDSVDILVTCYSATYTGDSTLWLALLAQELLSKQNYNTLVCLQTAYTMYHHPHLSKSTHNLSTGKGTLSPVVTAQGSS